MEYRMDTRVGREIDLEYHGVDFFNNRVGAKSFEIQFVRGSGGLDVSSKELDQITLLIVWGLEDFLVIELTIVLLGCQDDFCKLSMNFFTTLCSVPPFFEFLLQQETRQK